MPDETHPAGDGPDKWLEELIGRGAGDPDLYGYPNESNATL